MQRGSRRKRGGAKSKSRQLGRPSLRHLGHKEPPKTPEDAADVAYARRVVDDPDTEWVDWDDLKRELAGPRE